MGAQQMLLIDQQQFVMLQQQLEHLQQEREAIKRQQLRADPEQLHLVQRRLQDNEVQQQQIHAMLVHQAQQLQAQAAVQNGLGQLTAYGNDYNDLKKPSDYTSTTIQLPGPSKGHFTGPESNLPVLTSPESQQPVSGVASLVNNVSFAAMALSGSDQGVPHTRIEESEEASRMPPPLNYSSEFHGPGGEMVASGQY